MTRPIFRALNFWKIMERQFRFRNSVISYQRFGNGRQPVICFHGYGEEAGAFAFLEKAAGDRFSFFAFDLPFHGKTEWNEDIPFSTGELLEIVACEKYDKKPFLMGFSLGGRVALSLYETAPEKFCKLILLAPDGLKMNFWYWFSTQTLMGQKNIFIYDETSRLVFWFSKIDEQIEIGKCKCFQVCKILY